MSRKRSSGFALLLTLVLVIVAGAALTGLARRSAAAAVDALDATEQLQRRWAVASTRATLLDRAAAIIDRIDSRAPSDGRAAPTITPSSRRIACRLGAFDYEFVLVDEQSKLNVNQLWSRLGKTKARSLLKQLMPTSQRGDGSAAIVEPRPTLRFTRSANGEPDLAPFGSYDQLITGATPDQWLGSGGNDGLASQVTCWGDGKLHFRRAGDNLIELACSTLMNPATVRAYLQARRQHPSLDLASLLDRVENINDKTKSQLLSVTTDRSDCHALWIAARGPQRSWHWLSVGVGTAGGVDPTGRRVISNPASRRFEFSW